MLFVYGTYEHVSDFRVKIDSSGVYVSPEEDYENGGK
jgi:hypothetical protein